MQSVTPSCLHCIVTVEMAVHDVGLLRLQDAWRTSVLEHMLTRYARALGMSVARHRSHCRTQEEWVRRRPRSTAIADARMRTQAMRCACAQVQLVHA